ncbi:MAG: hypothetical protein ACI8UO_005132 [Verrucomicrobiales bacterium]|jgi:hypothetical protein
MTSMFSMPGGKEILILLGAAIIYVIFRFSHRTVIEWREVLAEYGAERWMEALSESRGRGFAKTLVWIGYAIIAIEVILSLLQNPLTSGNLNQSVLQMLIAAVRAGILYFISWGMDRGMKSPIILQVLLLPGVAISFRMQIDLAGEDARSTIVIVVAQSIYLLLMLAFSWLTTTSIQRALRGKGE